MLLGPIVALTRDLMWKAVKRHFNPELYHVIQMDPDRKPQSPAASARLTIMYTSTEKSVKPQSDADEAKEPLLSSSSSQADDENRSTISSNKIRLATAARKLSLARGFAYTSPDVMVR